MNLDIHKGQYKKTVNFNIKFEYFETIWITHSVYMYSPWSVVMVCAPGSVIPSLQNTHINRRTTIGTMADGLV